MKEFIGKLERLLKRQETPADRGKVAISFVTKALKKILLACGHGPSPEHLAQAFNELVEVAERQFCYANGGGVIPRFQKCFSSTLLFYQIPSPFIPGQDLKDRKAASLVRAELLCPEIVFGYDAEGSDQVVLEITTEDDLSCSVLAFMCYDLFAEKLVEHLLYYARVMWTMHEYDEFTMLEIFTESYGEVIRQNSQSFQVMSHLHYNTPQQSQ